VLHTAFFCHARQKARGLTPDGGLVATGLTQRQRLFLSWWKCGIMDEKLAGVVAIAVFVLLMYWLWLTSLTTFLYAFFTFTTLLIFTLVSAHAAQEERRKSATHQQKKHYASLN
jgi:membrane protein implicated in regulation of membrane protease activity